MEARPNMKIVINSVVILTAAALKRALDLMLSPEEQRMEAHFGKRGG